MNDHDQQISTLISDIYRHWREAIDNIAKSYHFTRTEWQIIGKLSCRGPSLTQSELCECTGLSGAQLTRALNRLEKNNITVRQLDPNNRRINHVSLKNPNARYIKNIEAINTHINELITQQLTNQEQKQLIHALQQLQNITKDLKETLNHTPHTNQEDTSS